MTPPDLLAALLGALGFTVAAALCAWILHGAGLLGGRPAAAVIGGVMGGLLLGGAVLGQLAPSLHERIYLGGVQERAALREAMRRDGAELAAMRAAGLPPDSINAARSAQQAARAPLQDALNAAESRRMDAHRLIALALVTMAAFAAGSASCRARRSPAEATHHVPAPLSVAIPCAATFALLHLLAGVDPPTALAAAGATGAGSMLLTPGRWTPAVGRQPGVWRVTAISLTFGVAIVLFAGLWARAGGQGQASLVTIAAGLLVVLAWPAGLLMQLCRGAPARARRLLKRAFLAVLAPASIAAAAVHLDFHLLANGSLSGWAVVACLILATVAASDGRWAGVYLGWLLFTRRRPRGSLMDVATETIGTGALLTQAVGASWLFSMGFFARGGTQDAVALACVLVGPVIVEPLIGVYRIAARTLRSETAG